MSGMQFFLSGAAIVLFSAVAAAQDNPIVPGDPQAQPTRYNVQNMNFDMWCQEQQHLPPERCDKRLPQDDAAFSAYRAKIERYELPYLQEQQRQQQLNTGILHNDPVDRSNQAPQSQTQPITDPTPPR
ncbi:MAG: hypothetical protein JOY77_03245 [Alphaproteobacteria bacterium]|nr:hypothetical protein [Alphaproteobacteria bacterium]